MKRAIIKYVLRFGLSILIVAPVLYFAGEQAIKIAAYKVAMVTIGVALAELLWAVGFKYAFGSMESVQGDKSFVTAVAVFRGLFYVGVILACAMGL